MQGIPDIGGMRITALAAEQFTADVVPDVRRVHVETIALLRSLGANVEEAHVPIDFEDLMVRNGRLIAIEAYAFHRGYIEDEKLPIDPWVRKRILGGKAISAADYIDELAFKRRVGAQFADWMRGRDALLTPTLPITATPVADVDEAATPLATYTRVANYLGACALSLPAGLAADGMPIGMQFLGAPFSEATLVRLGRAVQRATSWHLRHPAL
jgi:aspartyl-tRNA(Asn)/glutamyl-tRNA(Gln) amidotransferase subunit A